MAENRRHDMGSGRFCICPKNTEREIPKSGYDSRGVGVMNEAILIIRSPEHLLAQVYAMKCESEDQLQDLIDSLVQHSNIAAANVFSYTIELIKLSLINIEQREKRDATARNITMGVSMVLGQSTGFRLYGKGSLFNENRLHEFFKQQADKGINKDIRVIANDLLFHGKLLIEQMQFFITQFENTEINENEDFDPPNIPK